MIIRKAFEIDAEEISIIEEETFSIPWSKLEILTDLNNPIATYFVASEFSKIIGYIGCWLVVGEASITNLAVKNSYRQNGVGIMLLDKMITHLRENLATSIFLEVRESNEPAKKLYSKFNFKEISIRKNYYQYPTENAVVMRLNI